MSRMSRGCQQCRTRKVKCDQGRPKCQRCVTRGEDCAGYRDESDLIFRSENEKVESSLHTRLGANESLPNAACAKELSWKSPAREVSNPTSVDSGTGSLSTTSSTSQSGISTEDPGVWQFFDRFVVYPCNNGSSHGFLEHLPSLFKETIVTHRYALRYAVLAVAHASSTDDTDGQTSKQKAFYYYGLALSALAESLNGVITDAEDHVLMAVVVLDIFESLYSNDPSTLDAHTQGMKNILRLRDPQRIHDPRGWSLFRLSHHRLQRQSLMRGLPPMPESATWLNNLDEGDPFVGISKRNMQINEVCERGRQCLAKVADEGLDPIELVSVIREMHGLDQVVVGWHDKPHWKFKTVSRSYVTMDPELQARLPERIQLHADVWMTYEWNYHRTARIIMHCQLLQCLDRLAQYGDFNLSREVHSLENQSISVVRGLVDEILSTVPQSLSDINNKGKFITGPPEKIKGKAVGGYFLLWPIKITKELDMARPDQIAYAKATFERIREYTGMKSALGDLSKI